MDLSSKKMDKENKFEEIWGRIKDSTEIKTQKELAVALSITPQAITEMKIKGKFSEKWAYKLADKYGLDVKWILEGLRSSKATPGKQARESRKFDILNEIEEWLNHLEEQEPGREAWFEYQFKDSFSGFKKWKEEKEESAAAEAYTSTRKVA